MSGDDDLTAANGAPGCWDCATEATDNLERMFVGLVQGGRIKRGQWPAQRPVFLKPHGVAHGRWEPVPDLPDDLAVGVLALGPLAAWVRFSSDTVPSQPDLRTTCGIGIKLFGVPGEKLLGRGRHPGLPPAEPRRVLRRHRRRHVRVHQGGGGRRRLRPVPRDPPRDGAHPPADEEGGDERPDLHLLERAALRVRRRALREVQARARVTRGHRPALRRRQLPHQRPRPTAPGRPRQLPVPGPVPRPTPTPCPSTGPPCGGARTTARRSTSPP